MDYCSVVYLSFYLSSYHHVIADEVWKMTQVSENL